MEEFRRGLKSCANIGHEVYGQNPNRTHSYEDLYHKDEEIVMCKNRAWL